MLGIQADNETQISTDGWIGPAPDIRTPLPGPQAKAWVERDEKLSSPSYTRDYPLVVRRAVGSVIEDVDGNRFLDFAAGIAVCATGHCHPKVVAAITEQAQSLIHICGSDFYYPSMIEVMERLAKIAPWPGEKRVLLTNSGAEAVEAGIKLARYSTKRKWIIGFHGAFHGRTMGALSLTCSKARQRAGFGPLVPMITHVPYGDADSIESRLFKYQMSPDEVAAIFVEPMQGEGGYIVPPPEFLSEIRRICDRHGILMVCDEIQTGIGRTGKWFAFEHFENAVPDIILLAKGLASGMPLGIVLTRADVMNWPEGAQGSTFGGNPVACAAAVATLDLVGSAYMANADKLGKRLMSGLRQISESRKTISPPRGLGLMCAVDVINRRTGKCDVKLRKRIIESAFERGLVLLPCGEFAIRFCPPLCINEAQLEVGLRLFEESLSAAT